MRRPRFVPDRDAGAYAAMDNRLDAALWNYCHQRGIRLTQGIAVDRTTASGDYDERCPAMLDYHGGTFQCLRELDHDGPHRVSRPRTTPQDQR